MIFNSINVLGELNFNTLTNILYPDFPVPKQKKIENLSKEKNIHLKNFNTINSIINKKIKKNKLNEKKLIFTQINDLKSERTIKYKNFEIKFENSVSF